MSNCACSRCPVCKRYTSRLLLRCICDAAENTVCQRAKRDKRLPRVGLLVYNFRHNCHRNRPPTLRTVHKILPHVTRWFSKVFSVFCTRVTLVYFDFASTRPCDTSVTQFMHESISRSTVLEKTMGTQRQCSRRKRLRSMKCYRNWCTWCTTCTRVFRHFNLHSRVLNQDRYTEISCPEESDTCHTCIYGFRSPTSYAWLICLSRAHLTRTLELCTLDSYAWLCLTHTWLVR